MIGVTPAISQRMRCSLLVLSALLFAGVPGCGEPPRPGPVPLRAVILLDVQGLWGGQNLWLSDDGTAIVQIVEPSRSGQAGLRERRYRLPPGNDRVTECERLVGAHRFLSLKSSPRPGVPDESHPQIAVITKDGRRATAMKWENDPQPDFDPLYEHLLRITKSVGQREPVYEGAFDWDWHPEGFPSLHEILGWGGPT